VVVITAAPGMFTKAKEQGASAILAKPLDLDLLLRTVADLLPARAHSFVNGS
jgi:hypothetical protein